MIVKSVAIGAAGFAGYRYFAARSTKAEGAQEKRLAGGPLSFAATFRQSADLPKKSA